MLDGPQYRYGAAWYVTEAGVTCDEACEDLGGSNLAYEIEDEFADDDGNGTPDTNCGAGPSAEDLGAYWADNDNPAGWTNGGGTIYHTLGYGYVGSSWYSACHTGGSSGAGTYPGDSNNNATRNVMCPCHAMAGGPVNFKAQFTSGVTTTAELKQQWLDFQARLVDFQAHGRTFDRVTIRGSEDPVGLTCTGDTANTIATNVGNRTTYNVDCDGNTWDMSGASWYGVGAQGSYGSCLNPGYIIRPDITNVNWGGINGATCSGVTQTMEIIFD